MDWNNRRHVRAFYLNLVFIIAVGVLLLAGFVKLWLICVGLYVAGFLLLLLVYWLPGYLKARANFGKPVPPVENDELLKLRLDDPQLRFPGSMTLLNSYTSRSKTEFQLYETIVATE